MKKAAFLILALAWGAMATAQSITHVYHYDRPLIVEHDGYQQMGLNGCLPNGNVGEPSLPWQSVSLLLPQGQEALSYHVELSDWVEMDGTYRLFPVQHAGDAAGQRLDLKSAGHPFDRGEVADALLDPAGEQL